jgi:hypothetical protein
VTYSDGLMLSFVSKGWRQVRLRQQRGYTSSAGPCRRWAKGSALMI